MTWILRKTAAGNQTLQNQPGAVRIPPRLRALLLQVDGIRTQAELQALALTLGAAEDSLKQLINLALIETVPGSDAEPAVEPAPSASAPPASAPIAAADTSPAVLPEPSERAATAALLAQAMDEVGRQLTSMAGPERSPEANTAPAASGALSGKLLMAAEKMLGVASLIPGPEGMMIKTQISTSHDADELHRALKALRRAMKTGYRDEDADRILQPILRMMPNPTADKA